MMITQVAYSISVLLFCENDHIENSLYLWNSVAETFILVILLQKFQVQQLFMKSVLWKSIIPSKYFKGSICPLCTCLF